MDKVDKSLQRVLFLDYDGVVNTPLWNEKGTKCSYNYPKDGKVNNFQAVQWVSKFCQQCHYSIVVTSTWRKDKNWCECLINGGLRRDIKILGCTDITYDKRGNEIKNYLNEHPEVKYYIIVDDDNDFLEEQQSHFVQTDSEIGFTIKEYKKCLKIFERDNGINKKYK